MSVHGEIFDITFVGAGPVGLYGALYAGTRGLRVKVIESQSQPGGRLASLYPDKVLYDVAGHPKIVARELVGKLVHQCQKFKPEFFFNQSVAELEVDDDSIWSLHTKAGEHRSKAVVISAGVGAFIPKKLDLAGREELEGKGIYYDIEKKDAFKGKEVVVIGTGDQALPWAQELMPIAARVTLVHRLNRLNAPGKETDLSGHPGLVMKFPFYELKEIHGGSRVESVTIVNSATGEEEQLRTNALVLNIGYLVNLNQFKKWGLVVNQNAIQVNEQMGTNLPGVFAAGDIVTHPGKIKLISTGAGEAALAVSSASRWLRARELEGKRRSAGIERVLEGEDIFYSGYEAVQMAVALENQGLEFYRVAFITATSTVARELFAWMQRKKLDIVHRLIEEAQPLFKASQYAHEDLDDTAAAYLQSASRSHLFVSYDLAKEALKNTGSELQNIYIAIRLEQDLLTYLEKLCSEKKLEKAKDTFCNLIEEKKADLERIRQVQAGLMESGITI